MLAVADDAGLRLLEFTDRRGLNANCVCYGNDSGPMSFRANIAFSTQIRPELDDYFAG